MKRNKKRLASILLTMVMAMTLFFAAPMTVFAAPPAISNLTLFIVEADNVTIEFDLDIQANIFNVILPSAAPVPNETDIITGSVLNTVWAVNNPDVAAATGLINMASGLTPNTNYVWYMVAEDSANPGDITSVMSVPFRTLNDSASLISVAGQAITAVGIGNIASPMTASITVPNSTTSIDTPDIVAAQWALFEMNDDSAFTNAVAPFPLIVGVNHVYIGVLSEDGLTNLYYDITVIRQDVATTPTPTTPGTGSSANNVPQTNDINNTLGWTVVLAFVILGIFGLVAWRRRQSSQG